jgi:hypothetical protein
MNHSFIRTFFIVGAVLTFCFFGPAMSARAQSSKSTDSSSSVYVVAQGSEHTEKCINYLKEDFLESLKQRQINADGKYSCCVNIVRMPFVNMSKQNNQLIAAGLPDTVNGPPK